MKKLMLSLSLAAIAAACAPTPVTPTTPPADFSEQVARGQTLYGAHCASCHGDSGQGGGAPAVVGIAKGALPLEPRAGSARKEKFATVADVAGYVVANMPPGKGHSLRDDEYLAILAFDLHANGIDLDKPLDMTQAAKLVIPR